MRIVQDILTTKPSPSNFIKPTALVIDALKLLNELNLSYLVVMEGDEFKGIFSERDYSRKVALKGRSSRDTMVQDAMTTDLPRVDLSTTVEECMTMMATQAKRIRYLLVFDDGHFEGVITIHDLLRYILANREEAFDYTLTSKLLEGDESGLIY